jgi:hypothetical protein
MDLSGLGETMAGFGDSLMKAPELILILLLLIGKLAGAW